MSLFSPDDLPEAAPAYRVLARKYRPRDFSGLIGQDVLVRTLTQAIETGRLAQAWMLTGVRGVGKTTTARIIANALNCVGADGQGGPTPNPCGVCANCTAIAADRHVDVMEMDAASRTGVDDIREIIDGVRYNPAIARYKIYIIDEVHMLSKHAFNALLKTLEEPPPHVKFIFATTEIRKVPVTVLSRCQRFDLRRIDADVLAPYYAKITAAEGAQIEDGALAMIARAADGSARDGLSILDQAIARAENNLVTTEAVQAMLGLADRARTIAMTAHTLHGRMAEALESFNSLQQSGADALTSLQDMAELIRLLTRAKLVPEMTEGHALPELEKNFIKDNGTFEIPALTRAWQILLKGLSEVQHAHHPARAAEMVLIRIGFAAAMPTPSDLMKKIQQEGLPSAPQSNSASNSAPNGAPQAMMRGNLALAVSNAAPALAPIATADPAITLLPMPQDFAALAQMFAQHREARIYGELYHHARPVTLEEGRLEVALAPQASPDLAARIAKHLTEWTGTRWIVTLARDSSAQTLAEKDKEEKETQRAAALEHPLVKKALEIFPDATLGTIRPPPAPQIAAAEPKSNDETTVEDTEHDPLEDL